MITIVHGDDIVSSRKYFLEQKKGSDNILDGEKLTLTEAMQVFEGSSLFEEQKKIFIENFFKRKSSLEFKQIQEIIDKNSKGSEIYFWEGKELTKSQVSLFKNTLNKLFKFPQSMFLFLDSLAPNKGREMITLFHKTLENTEAELIFFMLIRQFRLLLSLSNGSGQIDEAKRLAPWQKGKLERQAKSFTEKKLKDIYAQLYEIDLGIKTGSLSLTLTQSIDMFLLNL